MCAQSSWQMKHLACIQAPMVGYIRLMCVRFYCRGTGDLAQKKK